MRSPSVHNKSWVRSLTRVTGTQVLELLPAVCTSRKLGQQWRTVTQCLVTLSDRDAGDPNSILNTGPNTYLPLPTTHAQFLLLLSPTPFSAATSGEQWVAPRLFFLLLRTPPPQWGNLWCPVGEKVKSSEGLRSFCKVRTTPENPGQQRLSALGAPSHSPSGGSVRRAANGNHSRRGRREVLCWLTLEFMIFHFQHWNMQI